MTKAKGAASFEVVCKDGEIKLVIHGNVTVARCDEDVYELLFDICERVIGGRKQDE